MRGSCVGSWAVAHSPRGAAMAPRSLRRSVLGMPRREFWQSTIHGPRCDGARSTVHRPLMGGQSAGAAQSILHADRGWQIAEGTGPSPYCLHQARKTRADRLGVQPYGRTEAMGDGHHAEASRSHCMFHDRRRPPPVT